MDTSGGRQVPFAVLGLAGATILFSVARVIVQLTVSWSLGQNLIGGAVICAVGMGALGLRKRSG
jgi:hypothetical protein